MVPAFSVVMSCLRRTLLRQHQSLRYLYPQDFESLIQAATSSGHSYALGGDFAGLAATFNPGSGAFIPIPEHMVPDALLDW